MYSLHPQKNIFHAMKFVVIGSLFQFVLFLREIDSCLFLNFINGNINNGCTENEIPNGYGEFGLTKTNPVPVKGILANEAYLSQLRTYMYKTFRSFC